MEQTTSNRRFSRIADLDRAVVKDLCDLHPWDLGQLCGSVGLDRSVLSNFFSGRRPLPQKVAVAFLRQLGLTVKGEADPKHCFVFRIRAGMQDLAAEWIQRLFPNGGGKIVLSNTEIDENHPLKGRSDAAYGVALYDGLHAAVICEEAAFEDHDWIPGAWEDCGFNDRADALLSIEALPKKSDVVSVFGDVQYEDVIWNTIKNITAQAGMSGNDVLRELYKAVPALSQFEPKEANHSVIT